MPPVNPPTPTSSANISRVSRGSSNPEDQDIWFDAIDHVEMEETWFDTREEHQADPSSSAGEVADSRVPFTEDCRRGVQQFVRTLGEYGENKILSACLSKILPGTPTSLVIAANSLYTAVTERRNIDTAALHALGLASGYLPENINVVSRLAAFIRDTVTGWTEETFLQQFLGNEENHTSIHLFTALAVTAIVAGRWMKDEGVPQRGILKVPAFMANIFIRASHYWTALGNMASSLPSGTENTGPSRRVPAFEVDTQMEMTGEVCDAVVPCASTLQLTAFSSNSTVSPEAYTRAMVQNRPAPVPGKITRLSVPEQAHYLAVEKLRQESSLSDLLYCATSKTETRQQINEKVITDTYFNTKCDATAYPEPLRKAVDSIPVHTDTPETQVSSAATSRSIAEPLLPIVMTAAAVATTSPPLQALKSKTAITAGVTAALTGAGIVGKLLSDKWPIGAVGYARTPTGSQQNTLQPSDKSPDIDQKGRSHGGNLGDSFGHHALHHDDPASRAPHRRRHLPTETSSTPLAINSPVDVRIEPVKKCYEYFGRGRLGGQKEVPCANEVNNIKVNNKQPERPPYPYIYTTNQPQKCKTKIQEQKCQKTYQSYHKKHPDKKFNNLVLNVGKTPCLCPPPEGDDVHLVPPRLQKKKVLPPARNAPGNKPQVYNSGSTTVSNTGKGTFASSTEIPVITHEAPLFIPLPEKRFIISPDLGNRPAPVDAASSVAPVDGWADVKIEKMYDFSCIDKRNNMSWADIIRQVGKTLRSPVQTLAAESQIVHHQNTLGKGCPSEHESQHLLEVTGKGDAVLSQVMQLLPGAHPVIVLQQIIGPVLEIYADELNGKPLDLQKIADINQQVLFLSRQNIAAQSPQGKIDLYKEPDSADRNDAENHFTTIKEKPAIILNGDKHEIFEDNKGNPYIWIQVENGEKIKTYVRYSWKNKKWNTLGKNEEVIYSDYNKKLIQAYHSPMSSIRNGAIDFNGNIVNVIDEKGNNQEHIYMGGQFVKVTHTYINGNMYYYPLSTYLHPKVIFSDGDMAFFEPIDSDKSDALNKLLEPEKISNTDEVAVAYSSDDFLFYDDFGGSYIKKDGVAYFIQDSVYKDKFIEVGGNKYVIDLIENNIDVLGERFIGSEVFTSLHGDNQLISVNLLNKIKSEGIVYAGELLHAKYTNYGFRRKINGEYVLPVDGKFYEIERYYRDDFHITVKTKSSEDDITVYMLNNAMTEARTKDIERIETEDYNLCVNRRSPDTVSTCKKISFSSALKSILEIGGAAIHTDTDLVEADSTMPGLYKNNKNGQLFFKFNNKYYLVKNIPMEETLLKYNSFNLLRHPDNKLLCTIIYVDNMDGEVLITTEEEYYSQEVLDNGLDDLKKNEKFIYPSFIYRIKERLRLVKEIELNMDDRGINRFIESIGKFFSGHEYDISRGLSYKHGSTNEFIIEGKIAAKSALIWSEEKLNANMFNLSQMDKKSERGLLFRKHLKDYFGNTFGIKDEEVLDTMISRYRNVVLMSKEFIRASRKNKYNNILFAATKGKKVKIEGTNYEETHTPLSDAELKIIPYMETSFEHHILPQVVTVFPERLHLFNPEHQQTYRHYPAPDMTATFIHEFTHAGAVTQDYMYFKRNPDGTAINGQKLIQDFNRIISNRLYEEDFEFLIQEHFSSIGMKVPEDLNRYLGRNDGFKSYLLINNADTYPTLIKEFAAWEP